MNILLDTHVIIWALTNDLRLTDEAKALIMDPDNTVVISTVSLWEIAVKNQKAPHLCLYHKEEILDYCDQAGYYVIGYKSKQVAAAWETMKEGSTVIYPLQSTFYSSARVVFVDRFGIRWGIMTETAE